MSHSSFGISSHTARQWYIKEKEIRPKRVFSHSALINNIEKNRSAKDIKELWNRASQYGTPLITKSGDNCQAIFLYKANEFGLIINLKSADLNDRLTTDGSTNKLTQIPGTDVYYLKVNNLPPNTYAQYEIQLPDKCISDPYNKHVSKRNRLHLNSNNEKASKVSNSPMFSDLVLPVKTESVSCMKMPQATLPKEIENSKNNIKIRHELFHSEKYSMFVERNILIYEPDKFDQKTGNVIFMLDGKEFCESLSPSLLAINKDPNNPLSNTAFVFIDSKMTNSHSYKYSNLNYKPDNSKEWPEELPFPDRVYEFYFQKKDFASMLREVLIPKYQEMLGVNPEQIILAGHSLAAYPVLDIAEKMPDIGGVILASPALNLKQDAGFIDKAGDLQSLPLYIQIGQLENTKPSHNDQTEKDMKNQSRLDANRDFHESLRKNEFKVTKTLPIHPSGHAEAHVLQGLQNGVKYIAECQSTLKEEKRSSYKLT
jgi:predicted alpha/beta superfamily hydrolase